MLLTKTKSFTRIGLVTVSILFSFVSTSSAQVFELESFTLDNGLEVVIIPNKRAPVVTQLLMYRVGAADEPWGKSGIAHFFEHLMFKATTNHKNGEFSDLVAAHGGRDNAFTARDYTGYYQTVASDQLSIIMELEADRMRNLLIEDDQIEPERGVILEERKSRTDNNPSQRLFEQAWAATFRNHPYGIPIIGWEHEIKQLSKQDLRTFYDLWYAPNNAILLIGGDVEVEDVRKLAELHYGPLEPSSGIQEHRKRPQEPPQQSARRVTLVDEQVSTPFISVYQQVPSYASSKRQGKPEVGYALTILSEIISEGGRGFLYKDLVQEKELAVGAGSFYVDDSYDDTIFGFYVSVRSGVEPEATEEALWEALLEFIEKGATQEQLVSAKQRLLDSVYLTRDNILSIPRIVGVAMATGSTLEEVQKWPEYIDAITLEQVNEAAKLLLNRDIAVTSVLKRPETTK
jgi:zinc protease